MSDLGEGYFLVCFFCGETFCNPTPEAVCGSCDYCNGLADMEDDR